MALVPGPPSLVELGFVSAFDAVSGTDVVPGADGTVWLAPFQAMWLVAGR